MSYIPDINKTVHSGIMMSYCGINPPKGWLWCRGQLISRNTYSNLFDVLGTKYGSGDGINTFNLPDFRGRFVLGSQTGVFSEGEKSGVEQVTLDTSELAIHYHYMFGDNYTGANNSNGYAASNFVNTPDVSACGARGQSSNDENYSLFYFIDGSFNENGVFSNPQDHVELLNGNTSYAVDPSKTTPTPLGTAVSPHNNMQPFVVIGGVIIKE